MGGSQTPGTHHLLQGVVGRCLCMLAVAYLRSSYGRSMNECARIVVGLSRARPKNCVGRAPFRSSLTVIRSRLHGSLGRILA
jgi:hypothetical protein